MAGSMEGGANQRSLSGRRREIFQTGSAIWRYAREAGGAHFVLLQEENRHQTLSLTPSCSIYTEQTSKCDAAQGKARSVVLLLLCQGEAATRRAGDGNRSLAASTGDRKTFGDPLSGKKKNVVGIPGTAALAVTPSAFNRSVL